MTQQTNSNPTHEMFNVVGNGKKARWDKIGIAFENGDGKGLNLIINYRPLIEGRLVVRLIERKTAEDETAD